MISLFIVRSVDDVIVGCFSAISVSTYVLSALGDTKPSTSVLV
ncbi:MAG: hypothetical protein ACKPKO_14435 [Candidatus Fonsibacter sp.]